MKLATPLIAAVPLAASLVLGACQQAPEPGESRGSTTPRYERAEGEGSPLSESQRAVRIGESGASFAACGTHGTTRNVPAGDALPVRAAPFEAAGETGRVASGGSFFVCSRSLDQKWFGIVYDEGGALSDGCGVSRPVPSRRDYAGPCRSGWVESASVRLVGR